MSQLGTLNSRDVVAVSTLEAHPNPALVGFFQVDLSDGSRELVSPSEALSYLEKGLLTADFFEAAKPVAPADEDLGSESGAKPETTPKPPKAPKPPKPPKAQKPPKA